MQQQAEAIDPTMICFVRRVSAIFVQTAVAIASKYKNFSKE